MTRMAGATKTTKTTKTTKMARAERLVAGMFIARVEGF
jgi:hypothetical protein